MNRLTPCLAAAMIGIGALHAEAQHVDILAFDDNGQIAAGYYDFDTDQVQVGDHVFAETFTSIFPGLFGTTAPGFYSLPDYALLPSSDLGFNAMAITHPDTQVASNLLYWNGLGAVNFAAPTDGSTLQFRLSSATNFSVDGSPNDVPGFVLEGTGPDGVCHKHISYSARGPGGSDPADGLYLASIELTMPGLDESEPVFMLFNAHYQRDEQDSIVYVGNAPQVDPVSEGLAIDWIEQSFFGSVLVGDLDGDGFVGINDLNIVLGNWNQNVPPANPLADPSGDGFVGIDDLNAVLGNWNAGTPPGVPSQEGAAVPEPAGLLLMGLAGVVRLSRRVRPG